MPISDLNFGQVMSVSKAKVGFHALVKRVSRVDKVVALTHGGVQSAVLLGVELYQGILETAEILSDRRVMRSLKRSLKQAGKGKWVSHRSVFGSPRNPGKKSS